MTTNDGNGLYTDSRVTNPFFLGYGIALESEKAQFQPDSHQFKVIDFNVKDIDAQIGLKAGGMDILPMNTCYNVNVAGQSTGIQIDKSIRVPSSISAGKTGDEARAAAAAYINAIKIQENFPQSAQAPKPTAPRSAKGQEMDARREQKRHIQNNQVTYTDE